MDPKDKFKMLRRFCWMTLLLSSGAHAFTNSSHLTLPTFTESGSDSLNGYIGGLSNQANSEVGDVPGNRYNGSLEVDYHKKPRETFGKEGRFTFAAQYNDESLLQYSLQEAYLELPLSEKNGFRIGRQILPWSEVDKTWGFGKLNNRRNFDFFEPGQEGLIGMKLERRSANGMRYRVFYSPVYVPETNPALDIDDENKTIKSRSPWGNAPEASTNYNNTSTIPIRYDVDYPEISEVIYRHSLGVNVGYESKHWVMDNFIIRKPENQISVKVNARIDPGPNVVDAQVSPQFYYHDVYGSTLKWRNKDVEIYASGIAIRPNTFPDGDRESFNYTDIKTEKRREDYVGGGISKTNDLYGVGFNYVARLSPFDRQKEELAEDPRWNQAVNAFGYWALTRKFTILGDLKYDTFTTDRLVMFRAQYRPVRNILLMGGVNMIGTPEDGKSYWSSFTNNDSVYGALRYVF